MATTDIKLVRKRSPEIVYRPPRKEDGADVWRLIQSCEPLDENSLYCNLLQCDHFGDTCIAAERTSDGALVGWVSAYLLPDEDDTLFVWQVAVDSSMRGQGLALRMLLALTERVAREHGVRYMETTISPDNAASQALFKRAFDKLGADCTTRTLFSRAEHFAGQHEDEVLYRAGPFTVSHLEEELKEHA